MFAGILLILIGGLFLLRNLGIIPFWYGWHEMWPAIIIALGLAMIADAVVKKRRSDTGNESK